MSDAQSQMTPGVAALLDGNKLGTLATVGEDGMPHLSVVYYANRGGLIFISTLASRLKARNIGRMGWASLSIRGEEPPYPSATFSGKALVRTSEIGEETALVMARIAGVEKPSEPQSDEALAEIGRVLIVVTLERVTSVSYI